MPHSPGSNDVVAAIFGADQQAITEYLVSVPEGMDQSTLVDEIVMLARVEGVVNDSHGQVYVAVRPADPIDDAEMYEPGPKPTIH